jgi:CRISPR-associated protein Cas1
VQAAKAEPDTVKPEHQPQDSPTEDVADEKDGVLIDGRLYVMTAGSFASVQRDDLVVRRRQEELRRIPLDTLTMLVLQGPGVGISVGLTIKLSERDVPVVFAPPFGRPAAIAASLQGGHSRLRQQQILRKNDPEILNIGIAMLAAKTGNQASVLKYFARYRKKQTLRTVHDELAKAAADIRSLADTLKELDSSSSGLRSTAMGYEGRAAALYWSSLAQLIPEELSFPGRRTRQATDPFNQAVNYVYGVLYGEVWRAIVHAGLDPYTGIMHGTERDQGSLIFDLIEEFRAPFGDRLVLGMLGRGFQPQLGKHGDLRTSVRRLLVGAFHRMWNRPIRWRGKMVAPARILEQQAKGLGRAFLAEETYHPFQFRW